MYNNKENLKEIISEEKILSRVKEIAYDISNKFSDEPPIFIGILKGSVIFVADLIREMNIDCEIDFIQVSSYSGASPKESIDFIKDISINAPIIYGIFSIGLALVLGVGAAIIRKIISDLRKKTKQAS